MTEVLLQLDPRDGNDPLEAVISLPEIPRRGDQIEVWVKNEEVPHYTGPEYLEVKLVVWCSYAPERVVLSVDAETYDRDEVARIFAALERNEQP